MKTTILIHQLISGNSSRKQLALALTGAFFGLFLIGACFQAYLTFQGILAKQKDLLGADFLVINKPVSLLNTISKSPGTFGADEMEELKKLRGIDKVGAFRSSEFRGRGQFQAGFSADIPALTTDLFFESVPDEFLDLEDVAWDWQQGDQELPIIIPSDYLKMYNFGFARGQGLPVVPESLMKQVRFDVAISGNGKTGFYRAYIAGFTERVPSILVPDAFLAWANNEYGGGNSPKPSRLILSAKDPASPAISAFFKEHQYEIAGDDKLKTSKINALLMLVMSGVLGLGLLVVILSLLGLIQFSQILAFRAARDIRTLFLIGYTPKMIAAPMTIAFGRYLGLIGSASLAATMLGQFLFAQFLEEKGFPTSALLQWETSVLLLLITLLLFLYTRHSLRKSVRGICG